MLESLENTTYIWYVVHHIFLLKNVYIFKDLLQHFTTKFQVLKILGVVLNKYTV